LGITVTVPKIIQREDLGVLSRFLITQTSSVLPFRPSTTLAYDTDFLGWQAAGRLFDGID
jgi:hypothetical protein